MTSSVVGEELEGEGRKMRGGEGGQDGQDGQDGNFSEREIERKKKESEHIE
jgi:hypothetical protein